jgi:hypothetical protein
MFEACAYAGLGEAGFAPDPVEVVLCIGTSIVEATHAMLKPLDQAGGVGGENVLLGKAQPDGSVAQVEMDSLSERVVFPPQVDREAGQLANAAGALARTRGRQEMSSRVCP